MTGRGWVREGVGNRTEQNRTEQNRTHHQNRVSRPRNILVIRNHLRQETILFLHNHRPSQHTRDGSCRTNLGGWKVLMLDAGHPCCSRRTPPYCGAYRPVLSVGVGVGVIALEQQ